MTYFNPLQCERCGSDLESDDAISIIEGICGSCRRVKRAPPAERSAPRRSSRRPHPATTPIAACPASEPASAATGGEPTDTPHGVYGRDILTESNPTAERGPPFGAPGPERRRTRDLAIGMVAGLFLTVAVAAYFLIGDKEARPPAIAPKQPTRSVTLRMEPPWAVAKLDDAVLTPKDESGKLTVSLPEDDGTEHWLEVSADGFHSDRRPVSMFGGVDEVFVELLRKPYKAIIRTEPAQAEVWINDALKGYSPLTLSLPPDEKTSLEIKRRGFVTVSQELAPPEKQDPLVLDFALRAAGPTLRVESDPTGAQIVIDGTARGPAPLSIDFGASYLGKEVKVTVFAPGCEPATMPVTLPTVGGETPHTVRLTLAPMLAELRIQTNPPGGRVIVNGKDFGTAPAVATFAPTQTGKSIVVQASLAGSYYGRRELTVPPAGDPVAVTIDMAFNARRVVFVLSLPADTRSEGQVLADQVVELIHQLTPRQRFSILTQADEGVDSWPGGLGTQAATSEQKVRAYDMIRSARPTGTGKVLEMMRASLGFRPNTIWLFAAGQLDRDDLMQFTERAKGGNFSVHVVRAASTGDDAWLEQWAARHHGTLTILGRDALPIVALDTQDTN